MSGAGIPAGNRSPATGRPAGAAQTKSGPTLSPSAALALERQLKSQDGGRGFFSLTTLNPADYRSKAATVALTRP